MNMFRNSDKEQELEQKVEIRVRQLFKRAYRIRKARRKRIINEWLKCHTN